MKRYTAQYIIILILAVFFAVSAGAREDTGCIKCHTDAEKIRSLYIPPKIEFKQDEGEG
jgi:hypothetical protein